VENRGTVTLVMSVTSISTRLQVSISSAVDYLTALVQSSNLVGQLVFYDKSIDGRLIEHVQALDCNFKITVIKHSINKSLTESIMSAAEILPGDENSWVQVIAEDDSIFYSNNFRFEPSKGITMYLPNLALLGRGVHLISPKIGFQGVGPEVGLGLLDLALEGDVSWHGMAREDVFVAFCKWLNTLPIHPNSISSAGIWMALLKGKIGILSDFLYTKEASNYDSPQFISSREESLANTQFNEPSLYQSNDAIYTIFLLSLLEHDLEFGREDVHRMLTQTVLLRYLFFDPVSLSRKKGLRSSNLKLKALATRKLKVALSTRYEEVLAKANLSPNLTSILGSAQ
jgi:hypothetical protein